MDRLHLICLALLCCSVAYGQMTCKVTSNLGCYTDFSDNKTRGLSFGPLEPFDIYGNNSNSMEICAQHCTRYGNFKLASVEYGAQCFCGNVLNSTSTKRPDSECNQPCVGNPNQTCGGSDRMTVFEYECSGTAFPSWWGCQTEAAMEQPYCDTTKTPEERVDSLISALTLSEKVGLISPQPYLGDTCGVHSAGSRRLGLGEYYWLIETNTGVASTCYDPTGKCSTTFSGPLGMAASFNRTNWRLKGQVLGTEMRAFNNARWMRFSNVSQDWIGLTGYGPNINIARDPRFGRTSELPGEDPYLNGHYAANMVQGMQTEDSAGHPLMLAYLKHFTAYSKEENRGHDTYNISLHDFFETYLAQYEIAFTQGKPTGAMCSYNGENGHPSCANGFILNKVIRGLWNRTDAHITTDCGAVSNMLGPPAHAPDAASAAAWTINNGTDMEMGSVIWTDQLVNASKLGYVSEATIDESIRRGYIPHFRAGRFDPPKMVSWTSIPPSAIGSPAHKQIQRDAALQSFVLLKNTAGFLPLARGIRVAVLGPIGVSGYSLLSDYYGDQVCPDGNYTCITTIAEGIAMANTGGQTTMAAGVDINSTRTDGILPALELAAAADVVVLALGIDKTIEHEGVDRTDTALPGLQEEFALRVLEIGVPCILVLTNGGALAFDNLVDGPVAIVEAYNPSVDGAEALGVTLFGDYNRWGKLVTTMYPSSYVQQQNMSNYDMSVWPGRTYKYYQGEPLFPFGYGLSYSEFALQCISPKPFTFTCTVTNTKGPDGDEVVLVYHSVSDTIRAKADHPIPIKSLVNFDRVSVAAGAAADLTFALSTDDLMVVNRDGDKVLYAGTHTLTFSRGHGEESTFSVTVPDAEAFVDRRISSLRVEGEDII